MLSGSAEFILTAPTLFTLPEFPKTEELGAPGSSSGSVVNSVIEYDFQGEKL